MAATSAFAQSTVTLSGNIDFAGSNVSGTQLLAKGKSVATTTGTSSTSVINIIAVEDLGGGMKVTGKYGLDPRTVSNDSTAVTNTTTNLDTSTASATTKVAAPTNTTTGLARDEVFVGIEGGFGNIRLGAPNSIGLNSFQVASPLGTGIGGGYTGGGTAGTLTNSFVQTRYNRSVRYDSPAIMGLTASALFAPGNDQAEYIASNVSTALLIPNSRKATEFGLRYSNGPVVVSYANVAQAEQKNPAGWYSGTAYTAAKTLQKTSVDMLNGSYALGDTTLYAGWNKGDRLAAFSSSNGDAVKTKGTRYAVKQTIGQIDLMASITNQTASSAGTYNAQTYLKAKATGARADYNFSKTSAAYVGYDKYSTGTPYVNTLTSGDRKIVSIGLRKSF